MKIVIVAFLVLVLAALGGAGFFMLRRKPEDDQADKRMARALAVRVGLSVTLFLLILLAYALGWIHPRGIPLGT
jgi:O-antigen/teichoic acid export membrane protein